jgi:hypothetical protein
MYLARHKRLKTQVVYFNDHASEAEKTSTNKLITNLQSLGCRNKLLVTGDVYRLRTGKIVFIV